MPYILYQKGEDNVVADSLSRLAAVPTQALQILLQELQDHPGLQLDNVVNLQQQDVNLKEIMNHLIGTRSFFISSKNSYASLQPSLHLHNGLIYKKRNSATDPLLVLQLSARKCWLRVTPHLWRVIFPSRKLEND